jgi:hypothetical protein
MRAKVKENSKRVDEKRVKIVKKYKRRVKIE